MTIDFLHDSDPVLRPLLTANDTDAVNAALEELLRRARPVIDAVVGHYRRRETLDDADAEDVASSIALRLFSKLQRMAAGEGDPIASFEGYVARLSYNAVSDVFRQRDPQRAALKKQVREIAMRDDRFVLGKNARGVIVRLQGQGDDPVVAPSLAALPADAGDAIDALLTAAGGPLLLNDVVSLLHAHAAPPTPASAGSETPLIHLERRQDMEALWNEIRLLPREQRIALLMNLRAEGRGNVVALFVLIGVTTFDTLAETLEMRAEELAGIWSELPWDDLTIANHLHVTRQRVINLRKSARKRLSHRFRRGGSQ